MIESLSNDDGDGNENGKKAIGCFTHVASIYVNLLEQKKALA